MADCTLAGMEFPPVKKRRVEANFGGGEVSSNGGVKRVAIFRET